MKKTKPSTADPRVHRLDGRYLNGPVSFHVIGAGGNGSQFINGLARLHLAMLALGHPYGLHAMLFDPDKVTEANIGRQLFSPSDIGQHKAVVLINRLNAYYNLNWVAAPISYDYAAAESHAALCGIRGDVDFLVGCVDSAASRRSIAQQCDNRVRAYNPYWLDLGNQTRTGQVVLGQLATDPRGAHQELQFKSEKEWKAYLKVHDQNRLPHILELFPALAEKNFKEGNQASCSLAESLDKQDLFINQAVTTCALNLIWTLFRYGGIDHHGYFVNLESGTTRPMPIDPEMWKRLRETTLEPQPETRVTPKRSKGRKKGKTHERKNKKKAPRHAPRTARNVKRTQRNPVRRGTHPRKNAAGQSAKAAPGKRRVHPRGGRKANPRRRNAPR
jgi:PRTRC genetic system ThiF family protein